LETLVEVIFFVCLAFGVMACLPFILAAGAWLADTVRRITSGDPDGRKRATVSLLSGLTIAFVILMFGTALIGGTPADYPEGRLAYFSSPPGVIVMVCFGLAALFGLPLALLSFLWKETLNTPEPKKPDPNDYQI